MKHNVMINQFFHQRILRFYEIETDIHGISMYSDNLNSNFDPWHSKIRNIIG